VAGIRTLVKACGFLPLSLLERGRRDEEAGAGLLICQIGPSSYFRSAKMPGSSPFPVSVFPTPPLEKPLEVEFFSPPHLCRHPL
jgi:hypothetical protein